MECSNRTTPSVPGRNDRRDAAPNGWRTGFAGSNQYFEPKANGYRQGFEYYWAGGDETYARVLEYAGYFLEGAHEEPFFLHAHLFDPHCPYDPNEATLTQVGTSPPGPVGSPRRTPWLLPAEQVVTASATLLPVDPSVHDIEADDFKVGDPQDHLDYYDGELLETDQAIATWPSSWEAPGTGTTAGSSSPRTWRGVRQHGRLGHGGNLYAETTWVPLIIRPPGGVKGGGRRITDSVSLVISRPRSSMPLV